MKQILKKSGFTLIELLVVIVILGILSTISVGTFRSYFAKARDSERVSAVQNLAMMIKVDSGGRGDCSVYNYTGKLADGTTNCDTSETGFADLLSTNDYTLPEAKNGLAYYYGVLVGPTEGDNDFFVVIGAEEENPQNGKEVGATGRYVFVDGTTEGIEAITSGDCVWETDNTLAIDACNIVASPLWRVLAISGCSAMNCGACSEVDCGNTIGCKLNIGNSTCDPL
jgi:prepilin-type N-terminal cleavage/methylation domain-containing protein